LEKLEHSGPGPDYDCLVELCDAWLKQTKKPTWRLIVDAVNKLGNKKLEQEILNIYTTGKSVQVEEVVANYIL